MTLVMTLLVRDEIDIIKTNLDFHLSQGVDHVLVIDNGSVDGTLEFVQDYARTHPVTLTLEPEQNYNQTLWMTRAAHHARDHLGATWVLNNDADEFWLAPTGNLKDALREDAPDMLICERHNMVFAWDGPPQEDWAARAIYRVAEPQEVSLAGLALDAPLPCPYFYRKLPPKVLTRTRGLSKINMGNHSALYAHDATRGACDIQIYHYPVRGADQMRSKAVNGGSSFAANTEFPESIGWHCRRWYKLLEAHGIDAVMADALPSAALLTAGLEDGSVIRDIAMRDLLM